MDNQEVAEQIKKLVGVTGELKDMNHLLRRKLKSVQWELDEYKKHSTDFEELYKQEHREKNELQRDRAALIEVLKWYGDEEIYDDQYALDEEAVEESWICTPSEMSADRGKRARTILIGR